MSNEGRASVSGTSEIEEWSSSLDCLVWWRIDLDIYNNNNNNNNNQQNKLKKPQTVDVLEHKILSAEYMYNN